MDWILDHLQVLIAIAAAVAYWLNSQRKQAGGGEMEGQDADEAERTRRIQEEIRRRIAERRGGQVPPQPQARPAPPPLLRPRPTELPMPPFGAPPQPVFTPRPPREEQWDEAPVFPAAREDARTAAQTAAILERQKKLAEEMRALEAARVEARKRAAQTAAMDAKKLGQKTREVLGGRSLGEELRDVKSARRAVVMREVLGAPVALR